MNTLYRLIVKADGKVIDIREDILPQYLDSTYFGLSRKYFGIRVIETFTIELEYMIEDTDELEEYLFE